MRSLVYVIFDKITGEYGLPFFSKNEILAIRSFDAYCNSGSKISEPTDFQLFRLGNYDSKLGKLDVMPLEFVKDGELKDVK